MNVWTIILIVAVLAIFGFLWKQGHLKRFATYVQQTREELKKCTWPSWEELRGHTVLVTASIAILGVFTVVVDKILFSVFFKIL